MKLNKTEVVALYSVAVAITRILSGPLTILIVSAFLSVEEMGFYYTFYSFVTMAMLFEVGVGYVLKQFYSYEVKPDTKGDISFEDKRSINHIFRFSLQWYALVSVLYTLCIGIGGAIYFSDYQGTLHWQEPFFLLVIVSGFRVFLNVFDSFFDGIQHQELINSIRLFSTLLSALVLWLAIYFGASLYSVAISQLCSGLLIMMFVFKNKFIILKMINRSFLIDYSFRKQFEKIFPLFGRTSIVWFFGYFFWNGFTLISFKVYGAEFAGRVGLSVSIARGGFDVANSFLVNQRTILANRIANGRTKEALTIFSKYFLFSSLVLIIGYCLFVLVWLFFPSFYIFDKILPMESTVTLLFFFAITLVFTAVCNFVRAYKVEPFVFVSIYNALCIPFLFWYSYLHQLENIFALSLFALIVPFIFAIREFRFRVFKNV